MTRPTEGSVNGLSAHPGIRFLWICYRFWAESIMGMKFISVIWSPASNTLSVISENQHGRECGSRFICFRAVKSKNNPSAICKALLHASFKAFHGRLLRRCVKQHVGVFHIVAQGFAPSSERVAVNEDWRDAAAFIHYEIKHCSKTWLPSWILEHFS